MKEMTYLTRIIQILPRVFLEIFGDQLQGWLM